MPKYMQGTKSQRAKLDKVQAQLDEGIKPQPPRTTQKLRNVCDLCSAPGVLRYHDETTCRLYVCMDCWHIFKRIAKWHNDARQLSETSDGYDPTCGMSSTAVFIAELANAINSDPEAEAIKKRLPTLLAGSQQSDSAGVNSGVEDKRVQSYENAQEALRTQISKRPDPDKNPGEFMDWAAQRWHLMREVAYAQPSLMDIRPKYRKERAQNVTIG
jgi:hypothetical protein